MATPLDKGVIGALKMKAVSEFNKKIMENGTGGEEEMNLLEAIQILWDLWRRLEQTVIRSAWSMLIKDDHDSRMIIFL